MNIGGWILTGLLAICCLFVWYFNDTQRQDARHRFEAEQAVVVKNAQHEISTAKTDISNLQVSLNVAEKEDAMPDIAALDAKLGETDANLKQANQRLVNYSAYGSHVDAMWAEIRKLR